MTTGSTALVLSVVLAAQSATQTPPTFRVRADLVQVDVVVVDGTGEPVSGLTQADFTLVDRGKPQTIATFDEVAHRQNIRPKSLLSMPLSSPPAKQFPQ